MSVLLSPINTALQSWKAARDQLVHAIDTYAAACTNLQATIHLNRPWIFEDQSEFDAALLEVEAELNRFELSKLVLENGVRNLRKTRNLSFTFTPINMLPQSLLLSVFSTLIRLEYAEQMCLPRPLKQTRNHPALTISSVCASWRNLVLESPTVWSTILLHERDPKCSLGQVWLAQAGDAPLDIKVMSPTSRNGHGDRWLSLLCSRHGQIRSLDLVLPNMDWLKKTLALWPQDSLASSLKTLSVKVVETEFWRGEILPKMLPDGAHEQLLRNITTFSLYGGYFDWDSAAFVGLEHLRVAWVASSGPTLSQLVGMLRASPRLRTLCLAGVPGVEGKTKEHQPVHLACLEKLSLFMPTMQPRGSSRHGFSELVPLLLPGSLPLTLQLSWKLTRHSKSPIEVFSTLFRWPNLESIYFHSQLDRRWLPDVFAPLSHLRHLYCFNNDVTNILEALSATSLPKNSSTSQGVLPCPQLREIHFRKCTFNGADGPLPGPITNEPTLIIKVQDYGLSPIEEYHLSRLTPGKVKLEFTDSGLPHEPPFDGVDCTRILGSMRESPGQ
ncbi:hypothetical protein FRC08_007625, partial [Ceratobasidium sp. 394]